MTSGIFLLMIFEPNADGTTLISASIASVNNIGPGFSKVGSIQNYGWFSDASKLLISGLMAAGRLELFAVVSLCSSKFWK